MGEKKSKPVEERDKLRKRGKIFRRRGRNTTTDPKYREQLSRETKRSSSDEDYSVRREREGTARRGKRKWERGVKKDRKKERT